MIEYYLRPRLQNRFIDPMARIIMKMGFTPKQVTIASFALGIAVIPSLVAGLTTTALGLLLLSGLLDILDGSLARLMEKSSPEGGALDIMGDRAVEFSVILGLFLVAPQERGLISILMLGSVLLCVTSFLIVGVFEQNKGEKSFHYSPGFIERAEAFGFFALMIILPGWFTFLGALFTLSVAATAWIRLREFYLKTASATR